MSAVYRAVADPDVRKVLIESLVFEHANQNISIIPLIHTLDFNGHLPCVGKG